jgi:hypothetical protein
VAKQYGLIDENSVERWLRLRNSRHTWLGQRIDVGNTDMIIKGSRKDSRTIPPPLTFHSS